LEIGWKLIDRAWKAESEEVFGAIELVHDSLAVAVLYHFSGFAFNWLSLDWA
jgi:hypothetical protein